MPVTIICEKQQMILPIPNLNVVPVESSPLYSTVFDLSQHSLTPPVYCHRNGLLFTHDSIDWLKTIHNESIDLVFADPPYNIKKSELGQVRVTGAVY
ncbi:MAG: hypothetical protein LBD04_11075 [Synergistaceae bacterium]|jgi:hypothetical protein|nr:hypothetical protein [Synergistaceae bacterium]